MVRKREILRRIVVKLESEIATLAQAAKAAHEAATHEESKAEDAHDTRGLEASYLAGAQRARMEALQTMLATFQFSECRDFGPGQKIAVGALVDLEGGERTSHYFLWAQGGGISVEYEGMVVQVITPQSPMGEALIGRKKGEVFALESPRGEREYEILEVI